MRILISRPDRIGDVVLSTPIPREIKRKYPDSYVVVLLRSYTKDIYINNPYVDDIIIYNETMDSFSSKLKEIRKHKFTHGLMLLPNEKINYLMFFAGIKTRVGVGHKLFQFLTLTSYADRKKYIPLRHEADYCMDLARKIGIETTDISTEIHLSIEERHKISEAKRTLTPVNGFLIGIHISSGNSAPNWEPSQYRRLVDELRTNERIKIAITDNKVPGELDQLQGVLYPNKDVNLRTAITNFAALDLLVSASTGPMHIAAALKVKTLSLFCPLTACSPELWGPRGNKSSIILPEDNYCSNKCPGDPKICTFSGEGGIMPEKVKLEISKFLNL